MKKLIRKSLVGVRTKFHNDLRQAIEDDKTRTLDYLEQSNQKLMQLLVMNRRLSNAGHITTGDNEVLAKIFSGLKMYIDPRDMAVAVHIALDSIWEPEITTAWLTVIKPEYTILDIGANYGYFGLLSSQFTDRKKSKIIMFEANPHITPYINKSISINWFNLRTKVENLAVSSKAGKVKLNILRNYIGSSTLQTIEHLESYMGEKMQLKVEESIEVDAVAIDDYCRSQKIDKVNMIKMDIEGHEEVAYRGMRKIIRKSDDITMFIEFTKESYDDPKTFYNQMLDDFGSVYIITDDGKLKKCKNSSYENVIGNQDRWVMPVFSKNINLDKLDIFKY